MKKLVVILLQFFLILLCTSCDFEGDEQRRQIAEALLKVKNAVNDVNEKALASQISEKYSYDDLNKEQFIQSVLTQGIKIQGYSLEQVELKEDKTQAKVVAHWRMDGGQAQVRVPVFQKTVSTVNMEIISRIRFYMQKENSQWKIVGAQQLDRVHSGRWGEVRPDIAELSYSSDNPMQGESIDMRVKIKKDSKNDAIFMAINGVLVGGYSVTGLEDYQTTDPFLQIFRIPADFPKRSFYEIKIIVFQGRINNFEIDTSELKGIHYKEIFLPVR